MADCCLPRHSLDPLLPTVLSAAVQNVANFSTPEVQAHGMELVESAISAYSLLDNALLDAMQVHRGGEGRGCSRGREGVGGGEQDGLVIGGYARPLLFNTSCLPTFVLMVCRWAPAARMCSAHWRSCRPPRQLSLQSSHL